MLKKKNKLSNRIIVRCVLMAFVICAAVCVSGYFQYQNSIYRMYNDFGYRLGEVALSYIDGNTITDYLESGEIDDKYNKMDEALYNIYSRSDISAMYICIPNEADETVTTVYDVRIHNTENPEIYALGVKDPIGDNPHEIIDIFKTGKRTNYYFIRKNNFGYNTSAVIPIKNDSGNVTALLLVDIPMKEIETNLLRYLVMTIVITVIIVAVFVSLLQIMLIKKIVKPLNVITCETSEFVKAENVISEKLADVKTNDEIETLAQSVLQMERDINNYIDNLTAVTAEKERIGAELNVATQIQASMLPCIFPAFPDRKEFDIYATMTPAKEVGGDFYDFFFVDSDHLALVMADVSGKGVPAALFMVIAKTLIKNITQLGNYTVNETLQKVNNLLCENNEADMFVTVWLGVLEISTGKLTAVNAGHEFPVIKRKGGDFELIKDKHGFVLGGMDDAKYRSYELMLEQGDELFLYTDGVPEAKNAANEFFNLDRMVEVLNKHKEAEVDELLPKIKEEIDAFVGDSQQYDDITMLAIKIKS